MLLVITTRYLADTAITCDRDFSVIHDAAIDVADGRIAWIGPQSEAPLHENPARNLGGLIMPGLVNSHAHTPMTLVRGAGDGLPLLEWLTRVMWPREGQMTPEDVLWGMRLGASEMLRAGVTSTCEMYLFEEAVVEASKEAGIRLVMTPGIISALHTDDFDSTDSRIAAIADFHQQHHNPEGLVTVGFGPHSAYDLPLELCGEIAAAARDLDTLLHIHVCETQDEGAELESGHDGRSTVQLLAETGVLDGRVLAAHSVWLDDADIETFARHDVSVAHCPVSNMKLASGVARVTAMRSRGVEVGLATDGPASNDDLDLWQEIKFAPLLARVVSMDASAMSPQDALQMATTEGSRAVGNHDVGSLENGQKADFIRVDLDDPTFVPVTCTDELIAHLAWSGSGRHVTDVWVAGEQVVADRQCLKVDVEQAMAEVQSRGLRLAQESGT
jgi:5-methylthioadenosine/S-adenosylhomocysteine deaminase